MDKTKKKRGGEGRKKEVFFFLKKKKKKTNLKVAKDDSKKKETRFCEEGGVRVSNEETEQKNAQHQSKNIVNKITKKKG